MSDDTIQKIADDLKALAIHTADHGISGWNGHDKINAIASRLRALSARASAGEGGEWVMVPRRLTAENGAKGLLSGEFAESVMIDCPECESGTIEGAEHCEVCGGEGQYHQQVPVEWTTIKEIHRMVVENLATTAPQPAQAGASGGMTFAFMAEVCDAAVQAMQANGLIKRTIRLQEVRDQLRQLAAAPQPQEVPVQECRCIDDYVCDRCNEQTSRAVASAAYDTPPAHGDGEGVNPHFWIQAIRTNAHVTDCKEKTQVLLNAADALATYLTTRPPPEAQEARDAVDARRYRYLRDHCKREWYSDMPHNKGAPSLDIEFEARGHDLDAAIDAALALPAQGEGKNGY